MIPRVSKPGRSFKGAMLYFAHDSGKKQTRERVGFVAFVNLPIVPSDDSARDLERAGAIMAWTAIHQDDIKRLHHHQTSPGTPYRSQGCKLANPVYTYSLRFAPDDAHRVDSALLRKAAHGSLKALGMESCQAAIVQHNDSIPPHVHIIVCLVDPKTGRTVSRSRDFFKLSKFAQTFSREHDLTIIPERERNNERRARGEIVKHVAVPRPDWELMRGYRNKSRTKVERERTAQQEADRKQLSERQRLAIDRFKQHLMITYGNDRTRLDRDMQALRQRMSRTGVFANATRFFNRVIGRDREIIAALQKMQKTRDGIDNRIAELRVPFARQLKDDRTRLANRHAAQLLRDEQYFEAREASRSEGDAHAARIRRATFADIARIQQTEVQEQLDAAPEAYVDDTSFSPTRTDTKPSRKKWSRATGRNPNRQRRPRHRY
ncbi:relaxase/mobilization nuclease domain-containing protein [Leptospira interrogans]